MSTIFSVQKLIGKGRNNSKRSLASTSSLVSLAEEAGAPKKLSSKLSRLVASSTVKIARHRADSIVSVSSNTDSLSSLYYHRPLPDVPGNDTAVPDADSESKQRHVEEAVNRAQAYITELEEALENAKDELSAKSETIGALTTSSEEAHEQLKALQIELRDTLAASKTLEEERDKAFVIVRNTKDAQVKFEERIQELEYDLKSTNAELSVKSESLDALNITAVGLRTKNNALETDLQTTLAASKYLEEERDRALILIRDAKDAQETMQTRIDQLEGALKSTKDELDTKSEALNALAASAQGLQSQNDALIVSKDLEDERDKALIRARDAEDAKAKVQVESQELSIKAELSSKALSALTADINALKTENDKLQSALTVAKALAVVEVRRLQEVVELERAKRVKEAAYLQAHVVVYFILCYVASVIFT
ncbi:hypothetical protein BDN70DRAFT_996689 [Pholiota conissans]|uniref:Uncharacterized protein n=1 Tax=Pholiota conissans TaxID=109636 RepID=A0A9P6CWA4_9AGAR|nr:hypothetical protein BDN70DRAFT_996689 [Pholiota conissans]